MSEFRRIVEEERPSMIQVTPSSSAEDPDDRIRSRSSGERDSYQTPFKGSGPSFLRKSLPTPTTVTQMTPSPNAISFEDSASSNSGPSPTRAPGPTPPSSASFVDVQQGFLDNNVSTALFRDSTPSRRRPKPRPSSRRSRLSHYLLLDDQATPNKPISVMGRRRPYYHQHSLGSNNPSISGESSPDLSPSESTPETSPSRIEINYTRSSSLTALESIPPCSPSSLKSRGKSIMFVWGFVLLALVSMLGMIGLTRSAVKTERDYELTRPEVHFSAAGLRGQMTSGHWDVKKDKKTTKKGKQHGDHGHKDKDSHHSEHHVKTLDASSKSHVKHPAQKTTHRHEDNHLSPKLLVAASTLMVHIPTPIPKTTQLFEDQDLNLYARHSTNHRRVVALDPSALGTSSPHPRRVKIYPADFTDNTQLYSVLDSSDERLGHMELHEPHTQGECIPMQDWQTTFHPLCNGMHEISIDQMGEKNGNDVKLFGTGGFWRYAWKLDVQNDRTQDTVVLKTLKFQHNFEDAHFEHDRIDAVAMERLTSSPHVINVFGFCGHSVITEFADGSRVGELADKSKKKPLVRLKIARDIAQGLADVHGIDGDGNSTFVHLDINPANVMSVGGTLKLNDFNIGIIRKWNTTSNTPCGFPAQYPNPQWRSPEEARGEQDLTEKVDVFSMAHIFFRLICGHEPWNKLEPGGRPSKQEVNAKVQTGELPFIPEHVRESENPEVIAIRDAMISCYTFDPSQRPSARDVANSLNDAFEALAEM